MRWRPVLAATVLASVVTAVPASGVGDQLADRSGAAAADRPRPVLASDRVGDPSVVRTRTGLVAVATGPLAPRARWEKRQGWRWTAPALARLPRWARAGDVWAPDLVRLGDRWVLYFAAPAPGLGKGRRCIGVATAPTAFDRFRPVGRRPLVCHPRADTPRALDRVPGDTGLPKRGVIDPSLFVDHDGSPYLLYKTDGMPSSIRLLPLRPRGLTPAGPSRELVRHPEVIENPVVLRRGGTYHLFTSQGPWARCGYRQVWRSSTRLTDWADAVPGTLLTRSSTGGLCGPAGGDVLTGGGRPVLYFHGWAVNGTTRPARPPFWSGHRGPAARRVMYAARLSFPEGVPSVAGFLGG